MDTCSNEAHNLADGGAGRIIDVCVRMGVVVEISSGEHVLRQHTEWVGIGRRHRTRSAYRVPRACAYTAHPAQGAALDMRIRVFASVAPRGGGRTALAMRRGRCGFRRLGEVAATHAMPLVSGGG